MPFSKFEPNRPIEARPEGTSPSAVRRSRILRWVTWVAWAYTAVGFGFIAYWLLR
ncbi:MAG TPA: hypothetical protein VM286_09125 [Candidatus Thermoplasmatota archaeon]|nr:hypothetical protein [Candidatus Thermoplasmatota archaeon]